VIGSWTRHWWTKALYSRRWIWRRWGSLGPWTPMKGVDRNPISRIGFSCYDLWGTDWLFLRQRWFRTTVIIEIKTVWLWLLTILNCKTFYVTKWHRCFKEDKLSPPMSLAIHLSRTSKISTEMHRLIGTHGTTILYVTVQMYTSKQRLRSGDTSRNPTAVRRFLSEVWRDNTDCSNSGYIHFVCRITSLKSWWKSHENL